MYNETERHTDSYTHTEIHTYRQTQPCGQADTHIHTYIQTDTTADRQTPRDIQAGIHTYTQRYT